MTEGEYLKLSAMLVGDAPDPRELITRPAWHADAACREHPEVNFYTVRGESTTPAKAVCAGCLVRDDCLADALDHGDKFGVWGGYSERERRAMRRVSRNVNTEAA